MFRVFLLHLSTLDTLLLSTHLPLLEPHLFGDRRVCRLSTYQLFFWSRLTLHECPKPSHQTQQERVKRVR